MPSRIFLGTRPTSFGRGCMKARFLLAVLVPLVPFLVRSQSPKRHGSCFPAFRVELLKVTVVVSPARSFIWQWVRNRYPKTELVNAVPWLSFSPHGLTPAVPLFFLAVMSFPRNAPKKTPLVFAAWGVRRPRQPRSCWRSCSTPTQALADSFEQPKSGGQTDVFSGKAGVWFCLPVVDVIDLGLLGWGRMPSTSSTRLRFLGHPF